MRKHLWLIGFLIISSTWAKGWKAGVAKAIITPKESVWQAGYASRTHASEGKLHDLWAKALALEDENGKKCVLVTTDMLGFPKAMSDRIRIQLNQQFGLTKAQIILNSSHTHSGPVLDDALHDIYPLDANEEAKIARYSRQLEAQIIELYDKFSNVKVYYDFVFNPNEEKLVREAKFKISNEYFPIKGKKSKMRRSVAQKFIKHFLSIGVDVFIIADLMLYNIEIAQAFSAEKIIKQELFYKSMLTSFQQAVSFLIEHGIFNEFQSRVVAINDVTNHQNWFNQHEFNSIVERFE
jgi:hypothetical protein